jgi:hypothetical protein
LDREQTVVVRVGAGSNKVVRILVKVQVVEVEAELDLGRASMLAGGGRSVKLSVANGNTFVLKGIGAWEAVKVKLPIVGGCAGRTLRYVPQIVAAQAGSLCHS